MKWVQGGQLFFRRGAAVQCHAEPCRMDPGSEEGAWHSGSWWPCRFKPASAPTSHSRTKLPFLWASPSSSAQTVYFGAVRLSVFVVNAFCGRDMVLRFHPDIPLGPSCGQCYKKQIMLLVSVLSDLHKTINTSHRDFLQLWFCGVVLWISSPLSRMCCPFLSLDLFWSCYFMFCFFPIPFLFEVSFEAVTTHRLLHFLLFHVCSSYVKLHHM